MRAQLPVGWPNILDAIVRGPGLWATADEILHRHGEDFRKVCKDIHGVSPILTVRSRCAAMVATEWLDRYELEGVPDPAYTLSLEAQERLGVEPGGTAADPRWTALDRARLPQGAFRTFSLDELGVGYQPVDPGPSPPEQYERNRKAEAAWNDAAADARRSGKAVRWEDLPRPRIILTGCATTWTERAGKPGRPLGPPHWCDVCKLSPLRFGMVCARCFRWCFDHRLPPPKALAPEVPVPKHRPPQPKKVKPIPRVADRRKTA